MNLYINKKLSYKVGILFAFFTFLIASEVSVNATYYDVTAMPEINKKDDARKFNMPQRDLSNDCNKFIDACIDQVCMDKTQVKRRETSGGVYDKCGRMSLNELIGKVNSCLVRFKTDQYDYTLLCKAGIVGQIQKFLVNKDELEKNYQSSTVDCIEAKKDLMTARNCHSVMMKSSGGVGTELQEQLYYNCGPVANGSAIIAADFFTTGFVGLENTAEAAVSAEPIRNTNWRQLVESKLAGYVEIAQSSCGDEDFNISQINIYTPDEKSVELQAMEAAAAQNGIDKFHGTDAIECRDRNIYKPLANAIWKYDAAKGCLKIKVQ